MTNGQDMEGRGLDIIQQLKVEW